MILLFVFGLILIHRTAYEVLSDPTKRERYDRFARPLLLPDLSFVSVYLLFDLT